MAHASAYFDAILFGRLVLTALLLIDTETRRVDEVPARIAQLVSSRTGRIISPSEVAAIIEDGSKCDVPTFRAIVETLEPPGGSHWFDPAFSASSARHFWEVNLGRGEDDA